MMDTESEAWRAECESRYVANLPSVAARQQYFDGIRKKCGARGEQRIANILRDLRAMKGAA